MIWLIGLAPEIVALIREIVRSCRRGRPDEAAMKAQRLAEVLAFKARHGWTPEP